MEGMFGGGVWRGCWEFEWERVERTFGENVFLLVGGMLKEDVWSVRFEAMLGGDVWGRMRGDTRCRYRKGKAPCQDHLELAN